MEFLFVLDRDILILRIISKLRFLNVHEASNAKLSIKISHSFQELFMTLCLVDKLPYLGYFQIAGNSSRFYCILDCLLYILPLGWILKMAAYIPYGQSVCAYEYQSFQYTFCRCWYIDDELEDSSLGMHLI